MNSPLVNYHFCFFSFSFQSLIFSSFSSSGWPSLSSSLSFSSFLLKLLFTTLTSSLSTYSFYSLTTFFSSFIVSSCCCGFPCSCTSSPPVPVAAVCSSVLLLLSLFSFYDSFRSSQSSCFLSPYPLGCSSFLSFLFYYSC